MKIRIVNLDFYMSNSIPGLDIQYSEFRGSSVYHVPVIRIYGSTEEGEKICLHVHGVFPYIYIPYDGQIGVDGFMYQIALGLDKAINISLGQASSNTQHVYKVCLISGIPFYGYHAKQHQYLKIYFYNPLIIKKACTLLQNGNILGKIYQPHEAHIPYILQFMIDYNLHGMSFINVSDLKYRADDYITRKYPENTVLPPSVRKMSVCKIEADTKTECILNREEITPGRLAVNPGIKALWDDEKQRRRNNRESSQMEQFLTQNRIDKPPTSTHIAYKKMLDEKLRLKPKLTGISPELELSVYPAETPPDSNLLNASTIDVSSSQNTDDSIIITNESILDEDGRELYDLLRDLKEDNIEKDSILSQVQKEDESDGENDIDLSLPLDVNLRTPRKIEEIPEMEFLNDSYFETLGKLPQLDGVCDDLDAQPRKRKIKKNKTDGKNNIKAENLKDWDLGLDNDYFLNLIPNKENIKDKSYYLGNTCEMRKRSSKKTFKVKTSAIFCKSKLKFAKIQCNYCFKSHPKTQRCIKSYFRKDEEEQINDVIGKICQDINAEELKWEKRLDIGKVVEDICQNLTIEKRSKSKKLSKKLSCSYCPSDKQKQHDVVIVDANQNLLTETSVSEGKKGLNENKLNKRGRRKKTVTKVVETTIIEENCNLDPHEEKITVKNGIKPLSCVLGKVKRSRKKKNLINDDKTNRQLGLSLSDKDPPIPDIKIRKNCIKKTSQASTPLNMPSLCDSNECNNIDDIEDNNNNINTVNLNNAASAECLLASEQPNLAPQQGRYNLRSRKPKPPKPPADLPKIPIEKSKTKSKPKRPKQSKNKQTQTLNLSAKSKRKPATKPLFNIIVTKTQKIDSYNIKVCPIKKDGKPCDYYELGPNPKPKFRVIAGKKPYTFNVKNTSAKYPNTTWSSYYKPQNLESNSIKNDDNNSIKIISNQILENGEKYCETEIKKGAIIDTMKIEPKKLDRLTSQEEKAVDALTELYDEIQGEIFPQIDVPEIFESLKIGDETTDGAPSASITSSNSLSNYREDMKRTYDNLMEKMGRSLNDLFDNISPVRRSSRIQKDLSRKKDAETKQKNVSFNDVCSVRSYHSESLYLFDDDEMEMIDDKAPAPSKSERKPLISLDRQAPIKQKMLPSELGKVPTSMKSYKIPKLVRKPLIPLEKQVVSSVEISSNLKFEAKSSQVSNQQNLKISPNTAIISGSPPIRSAKNSTPRSKSLTKKVKPIFANPTEFKEAKDNNPKSVDFARASLIKRYRNLQRLLSIVSENSEPINYKMDIDYRVVNCKLMMQKLQQQLLDLSRSRNSDPHLHRCNCMNADFNQIKLRTVNVAANYRTFNPDLNLLKQYSDLNNYVPDSDKSKDGLSVASRTNKGRKRKTKKKNTKENKLIYPVNQYASLDGPNDSSSDDDQPVRPAAKRRCVQPRKPLSESLKYSPLKVHYGSPTKSTDLQKQVNRSPISFTDEDKKETSKKFKRKLSFSRKTFNKTQSEEKLTCVYRSNKKTLLNIVSIPTPVPESTINLTQNESSLSLITPYQKPRQTGTALIDTTTAEKENEKLSLSLITPYQREHIGDETFPEDDREDPTNNGLDLGLLVPTIQTLEPSNCASTASEVETNVSDGCREQSGVSLITPYQKVDVKFMKNYDGEFSDSSASLSDDIFSPNLPNSSEIFTFDDESNGDRDPAKLYDVLNNYIPQAGTSKLTGSSVGSVTPKQLSSNSIETIASADNRSSENDVITPYQKEIAPLSVFEFANRNHRTGPVSIIPKIPPPSRKLIEDNLRDYDIPEVYHKEAFYSNAKDVTGPVEIGVKVLRILSDKIGDLPEFESSFKGIDYYRREYLEQIYPDDKITIKDINNYKKSFCKISNCVIRTAELPPTKGEVKIWLKNKLESDKEKSTRIIEKKKRILIPCSPGNDQDDDSDDSLTISPCTPLDETLKNVPQQDESPVIKRNEALQRYRKRKSQIHSSEDSSGKSLELTKEKRHDSCQITGVTLDDLATSCDNLQKARAVSEYLNLTVFCMELIVETRNNYNPDPSHDVIKGIIYKIFNDVPEDDPLQKRSLRGCFLLDNMNTSPTKGKFSILDGIIIDDDDVIKIVKSEAELITQFVQFFIEIDPDILIGYEIEMLSWGYLIERGYVLNLNLISLLSRVPISTKNKPEDDQADLTIPGRIILDFWRLLRHEIALQSYTFENIVYHILHQRAPLYSFKTLTNWWNHTSGLYRDKVLRYYYYRIDAILKIIERLDLIGRTSELAKLFGIQFFEVLSRGSQFRVESMMLRLAKPLNYIAVSPNVQQRARMRAPESLPLIMEPESKFYVDPVIVLDFQSLYPSMIIAYNYCFSTCLGRIEHLGQNIPFEFGATHLKIPRKYVKNLSRKDLINISPCGVGYVKKTVREGILPKMLQEILDTRLMVKKSLKKNSGNKILERVLDARQLGLKLIANVTYGYTAANFSGRMPCIEVGDSVVSKGRETLQRAINLVEKTAEWGARVVYGDTDSLFVLIPGRSRQEAFRIGAKIAEAVTEDNPSPVKLKLEKIFHPCILQTKKRYVGYMFESPDQVEPEYCAKGIETVRRDGCPAVSKMLEKCLKILFDTRDVSLVRQYVVRQFSKILTGRISIQDLTFAKEYRGASNYRPGACVPALELARKWIAADKRSEPRRKERVPYVIVNGPPGLPLIKLVRSPRELIADPSLRPNALYYITKVIIPPINRCFLLIGADVNNWFNDMPRKQYTSYQHNSSPVKGKKSTISQYFSTRNCAICAKQSKDGLCDSCLLKPQSTSAVLHEKIRVLEQNYFCIKKICELCCCTSDKVMCISLDCPVYYKRVQINKEIEQTPFFRELIAMLPSLDF